MTLPAQRTLESYKGKTKLTFHDTGLNQSLERLEAYLAAL
jgi:hypothetical protein